VSIGREDVDRRSPLAMARYASACRGLHLLSSP
jgi:hypothetical protein